MEMLSPCSLECFILDDSCVACKRTIKEIMDWDKYTDQERQNIMKELEGR